MPASYAAITTPQVEGITRQELLKRFMDRTGFGVYGVADSGSATTLVDDALIGQGLHAKSFVGGFIRIVKDAGGAGSPEGKIRPVTVFDPATGTVTFPTVTDAIAASDEYEVWKPVMHPSRVLRWIDEVLTESIYSPCMTLLTMVPDGDMEQSHTTDWAVTNATRAKVAADGGFFGKYALAVTASAANGYAKSVNLQVRPGERYHASALGRCVTTDTDAKFQVYDETNSAEIDSVTSSYMFTTRMVLEFTVPATCYAISIRLITTANTFITRWDEVCFYPTNTAELPLPWWVRSTRQVYRVFKLAPNVLETEMWDYTLRGDHAADWEPQDRFYGDGQLRVVNRHAGLSAPLYIMGGRNEDAYANDYTEEKYILPDLLLSCLLYKAYEYLSSQLTAGQQDTVAFQAKSRYWQATYKAYLYQEWTKVQQLLTGPKMDEAVLDGRFAFRL